MSLGINPLEACDRERKSELELRRGRELCVRYVRKEVSLIKPLSVALVLVSESVLAEGPGGGGCQWVSCFQTCNQFYSECRSDGAQPTDGCYWGMRGCYDADSCCEDFGPDGF